MIFTVTVASDVKCTVLRFCKKTVRGTLKINEASNQKIVFDKKYLNNIAIKNVFISYDRKMTRLVIKIAKLSKNDSRSNGHT